VPLATMAAALRAHDGDDGARAVPDALHVDGHDAVPLGLGDRVERLRLERGEDRGVVDEHVDASEADDRRVDHGLHRGDVADVGPEPQHAVGRAELPGRRRRVGDVGHDHPRALGQEAARVGEADAGRPAGDDGDLVREPHGRVAYGLRMTRVAAVPVFLPCHSAISNALLTSDSGKLCETTFESGYFSRVRTRKSRAAGMIQGL
jgi:hypothetical protein